MPHGKGRPGRFCPAARSQDRSRQQSSGRSRDATGQKNNEVAITAPYPNKEVAADARPRMPRHGHDLESAGGELHEQRGPRTDPAHSPQSHSNPAGTHRVSALPVEAELHVPLPQQQQSPTPQHVQKERYRHSDSLTSLCAPASRMHAQHQSSSVVDIQLSQLLAEKRRLLRGVSAKLGEKVVSSVLESALVGPAPALETYMEAAPPVAWSGGGKFAGASLATDVIHGAAVQHYSPQQALVPSSVTADRSNQGTACAELRSLCASLRDSIGRKRVLLDRLQSVT